MTNPQLPSIEFLNIASIADGGWAGQLNWSTTPEPEMQLKQVVIEGCQLNA